MELAFDKGSEDSPRGHALLYFRSSLDPEELWATYLVVLPITVDVSKYVPPFLMNQVGELGPKDLSAFAFPPAPERVPNYAQLEELAAARNDDILAGGTVNPTDVSAAMMSVNEAVQRYVEIYTKSRPSPHMAEAAEEEEEEGAAGAGVNEVLYGLMSENDKLGELTKLVGRLRFDVEGAEEALAKEAEADIRAMARHLPENHQISRLIEAARAGDSSGTQLADLYLQRCFHLVHEEYVKLGQVEEQIRTLEASS